MSGEYPCVYYDHEKCQKFSDNQYNIWCDHDNCEYRVLPDEVMLDELAVAKFNESVSKLREALVEAFQPIVEWAAELTTKLSVMFTTWHESCIFVVAYFWARDAHPEWVKILNRTKKKRTRKKYQDRILRAYLKNKEEV